MLRVWKWYQKCLATHPVKTQAISSAFIWGFGDIAAQTITTKHCHPILDESRSEVKINWRRVATTSLFGLGYVGPVGHFWYEGLERMMRLQSTLKPNSMSFIFTKVAVDAIIFGPLDLLVFFTYMGLSAGKTATHIKEDIKRDFLPALVLEGCVWPIFQVANFSCVPVQYQLLCVNLFCLLDSCFLSWIEQQEDTPWKQWFSSMVLAKGGENR